MKKNYLILSQLGSRSVMAGNVLRMRAEFYVDHVLTDMTAVPTLTVKIGTGDPETVNGVAKVTDTTGLYSVDYSIPANTAAGDGIFRFEGTYESKTYEAEGSFTVTAKSDLEPPAP